MIMDWTGLGPAMMTFMSVVGLLVLVVIVLGVVYLVRGLSRRSAEFDRRPRAVEILEKRFARGDINRDEYEDRSRLLSRRAS